MAISSSEGSEPSSLTGEAAVPTVCDKSLTDFPLPVLLTPGPG